MAVDWRKNEHEFETDEGVAKYLYMGKIPWRKEKKKIVSMRGYDTWASDGVEDVPMSGDCMRCGKRLYKCLTHPLEAEEMEGRTPHVVKNSRNEPPSLYCNDCVYEANPSLREQVLAGVRTAEEKERDAFLADVTRQLGGAR